MAWQAGAVAQLDSVALVAQEKDERIHNGRMAKQLVHSLGAGFPTKA